MRIGHLFLISLLIGCMPQAPAPPIPRLATAVAAPISKVWDSVIDTFAERNIPIRTLERASGFVATDALLVDPKQGMVWADCATAYGVHLRPALAIYNVVVRGDSVSATVKASVLFQDAMHAECSSRGVWETQAEADIKARAEGNLTKRPDL